jgi:hypothetical protein
MKRTLVGCLTVVALLIAGCSAQSPTQAKVGVATRTGSTVGLAASGSPHLGDGVCAASMTAGGIRLLPVPAGTTPTRQASSAIAVTRSTYPLLPADATFGAYPAMLDAPNLMMPNPHTAMGPGPFTDRLVWVVEVGGLSFPDPSNAARTGPAATGTTQPTPVLHHMLDFVDDATGLEPFSLSCS